MRESQIQSEALKVKKNNWMNSTEISKIVFVRDLGEILLGH